MEHMTSHDNLFKPHKDGKISHQKQLNHSIKITKAKERHTCGNIQKWSGCWGIMWFDGSNSPGIRSTSIEDYMESKQPV